MWRIFREMRAHQFSMQGVVTAWKQWTRFSQAHRLHETRSKERSKQRKLDLLAQAQQAADRGDAHGLWRTIKQLAPRAPRRKLQLHKNGHMIPVEEELEWILDAYGERYQAGNSEIITQFTFPSHPGFTIQAADLVHYLSKLNPRKAVPRDTAPAILWKSCSELLAEPVAQQLNAQWEQGGNYVPEWWSDADVALLPKAHGRNRSPLDWRPIGVQDPLGKCVMSTIILQAKQAIRDLIIRYPQCAYVQGRSTHTALRQVFAHCRAIRTTCSQARLTIHQKHEGLQHTQCQGGVQASLDLTAAFDLIHWEHIKEALDLAQVDVAVQDVLLCWLTQVRYHFNHQHLKGTVKPKTGLRQGCTGSPVLSGMDQRPSGPLCRRFSSPLAV